MGASTPWSCAGAKLKLVTKKSQFLPTASQARLLVKWRSPKSSARKTRWSLKIGNRIAGTPRPRKCGNPRTKCRLGPHRVVTAKPQCKFDVSWLLAQLRHYYYQWVTNL